MEVLSYQRKIKTSLIYFNIILKNEGLNMKYYNCLSLCDQLGLGI